MPSPALRSVAQSIAVGVVYVAASKVGLSEPCLHPAAATVWVPTGIALASVLIFGVSVLPAIFAGALIADIWSGLSPVAALGVAAGNVVAAFVGAWLVRRFARGVRAFERPRHVFVFVGVVTLIAAPIGAAIGVTVLLSTGKIAAADLETVWTSWWMSDVAADLIVAPLLILWAQRPRLSLPRRRGERRTIAHGWRRVVQPRALEALALIAIAGFVSPVIFTGWLNAGPNGFPLTIVLFPILIWSALRFGARETATILAAFSGVAVWGAVHGVGPFASGTPAAPLRLLQLFLSATGVTGLAMAAVVDERNRLDSELHLLAITDPLTGLANYRHLTGAIDREIRHAKRGMQSFAVLLLDVDNLKTINDRLGHNVGSRLLVRLADSLRASCRVTDLIARYGGDEFAVVLPGCNEEAARVQAVRLQEQLAADPDSPAISVSLGISVYPRDGENCDELLDSADNELYTMKGRSKKRSDTYPGRPTPDPSASLPRNSSRAS